VFQDSAYAVPASNKVDLDRLQAIVETFPLEHVVTKMAHKSVRTSDWVSAIDEKKTAAICARISELKEQNLWSLRQPVKQKTPSRPNTHWDYLLKEMEWLATDFYEERKFKMAGAFLLAKACQNYHQSTNRESLLHKVVSCMGLTDVNSGHDASVPLSNTSKRKRTSMRMC
jgi:HSA